MRKSILLLLVLALLTLPLSSCAEEAPPALPEGVSCTYNGTVYTITGYDAAAVTYMPRGESGQLCLANPYFLGDRFAGVASEGSATLSGNVIEVIFTIAADGGGTVTGPQAIFSVDTSAETVTASEFTDWEGETFTLTDAEMLSIAATLGDLLRAVEALRPDN